MDTDLLDSRGRGGPIIKRLIDDGMVGLLINI